MIKYKLLLILFMSGAVLAAQPNFVLILSDDMGWNGSSVSMNPAVEGSASDYYITPALETLAEAGMTFSQAYAPAPKCAPSRASILTGKTTARNRFTNTGNDIATDKILIEPTTNVALNNQDITLAEWLKDGGRNYRTAHFGKWHLRAGGSDANGFDEGDGNTGNSDGNNSGGVAQEDPKKIFELTNKAISFMSQAQADGVPFFLQLSHYAVHTEIEARQSTIDLYNNPALRPPGGVHNKAEYGAMTEDMDEGIGLLLDALNNLGLDENTYVIFTSDNGAQANQSSNFPLRRSKTFIFEGGVRVPFIIKGPGITPASYENAPIVGYDLFPTLAALSGIDAALPLDLDGTDISPLFFGGEINREEPIYFHSPHYDMNPNKTPKSAVVYGQHKLIVDYETGDLFLYDLEADIGESANLADEQAALRDELRLKLRNHLRSVDANMPSLDPGYPNFSGTSPDVDKDGLNDAWEFSQLLSHTYGPEDDPDGDGLDNLEEMETGGDPLTFDDAGSGFDCDPSLIFANTTTSAACFTVENNVRYSYSNSLPGHAVGTFPTGRTLEARPLAHAMCASPQKSPESFSVYGAGGEIPGCSDRYRFGVGTNGVRYDPFAAMYFVNPNTGRENRNWNVEAVNVLNVDFNGGHINPAGEYHYHAPAAQYFSETLHIDGSAHSPLMGYAADGYPIYYKYVYENPNDSASNIIGLNSCFRLKSGNRPGDGVTDPDGPYDGTYAEDYEYVNEESCLLDECNGRFGLTPEYPEGTYYYVLTDEFPWIPRCFYGSVLDDSFRIGPNCPASTAAEDCSTITSTGGAPVEIHFKVYPNPSSDWLQIEISSGDFIRKIEGVRIYDLNGRMAYKSKFFESEINIGSFEAGIYFLQLDFAGGQLTRKVVVK